MGDCMCDGGEDRKGKHRQRPGGDSRNMVHGHKIYKGAIQLRRKVAKHLAAVPTTAHVAPKLANRPYRTKSPTEKFGNAWNNTSLIGS